jgi:hypothetical protein
MSATSGSNDDFVYGRQGPLAEEAIWEVLNYGISVVFEYSISLTSWGTFSSSVHASTVRRDNIQ